MRPSWRRSLLSILLLLLLLLSALSYLGQIASLTSQLQQQQAFLAAETNKPPGAPSKPRGAWVRAVFAIDLETCCVPAGGGVLAAVKEGKARLLTISARGVRSLADSRGALARASGAADIAFLSVRRHERCLEPLSAEQEAATPAGALESAEVVAADRALVGGGGLERQQAQGGGHFFWAGRGGLGGPEQGRRRPSGLCGGWVRRQALLAALEGRRTFWVNLTGESHNAVELVGQDAMQYAGWRNEDSGKLAAALVIRGGIDDADSFAGAELGEQAFLRHPHVSNITAKDALFWNLRRHVRAGRSCLSLEDMVPRTWLMDDPLDCRDALQAIPLLSADGLQNTIATPGFVRKVGPLHMGEGISMVHGIQVQDERACRQLLAQPATAPGGPSGILSGGGSRVLYQTRLDPFKVLNRSTSIRVYLLVASFNPLIVFFNHVAGHVYLGGVPISSEMAWYTQQRLFSAWTFEALDRHIAEQQGIANFFYGTLHPRMKDILATVLSAMEADRIFESPDVGGLFDLLCADFMLDQDRKVHLLEVSNACMFKGYGQHQEQVRQRVYLMRDALDLGLDVATRVLRREPIWPLLDSDLSAMDGRFELLHYDGGAPGPGMEKPFRHTVPSSRCSRTSGRLADGKQVLKRDAAV